MAALPKSVIESENLKKWIKNVTFSLDVRIISWSKERINRRN